MTQKELLSEFSRERVLIHYLRWCGHYLHKRAEGGGQDPLLCMIYENGGSMSQQELLSRFAVKSGSLSEILAKLEDKGLIERTRTDADRRKQSISLTKEGKKQAKYLIAKINDFEERAFSCFKTSERKQLLELLERLKDHWSDLECES